MSINARLVTKRLSKTRLVGRIIARLPFVRCVILNGSLASGGHKESSDIDILIIAKTGHIFTTRFFVNAFGTILGIKRSSDDKKPHAGKFCFNYFLTENFLTIPIGRGDAMDRYCAQNYSASRFIAGDINLFNKFMEENQKLFNTYSCHCSVIPAKAGILHQDKDSGSQASGRNDTGKTASTWFERWAKKYQIRKIESDPRTKQYPNLIVFNDKELRFHPPRAEL